MGLPLTSCHSTNVIYLNVRYNLFSLCCGHSLLCSCTCLINNCSVLTSWVLRLCHNTLSPARTPRQHKNAAVHRRIMCGLPSDRISALHNCTQPSETEINPLKTACGSPCGREIKIGHAHNLLTQWNVFVNVQLPIPGDP